jgi:hypothetical protein
MSCSLSDNVSSAFGGLIEIETTKVGAGHYLVPSTRFGVRILDPGDVAPRCPRIAAVVVDRRPD